MSESRPEAGRLRKGWCPGALRPMPARDGLLLRLRLTGNCLSADNALALADLADLFGSGLFELTARANLQLRGIEEERLAPLHASLHELGLLDADPRAEAVRNVLLNPLAGLGDAGGTPDCQAIAQALERMLVSTPTLFELPAKFGFLIDDDSTPSLAGSSADVRFDWHRESQRFAVGLGGTRKGSRFAGWCAAHEVVARARTIADWAVGAQTDSEPRRMAALLAANDGLLPQGGSEAAPVWPADEQLTLAPGRQDIAGMPVLVLAAPFGRFDATMMRSAARIAAAAAEGSLRLSPWRMLLIPGVEASSPAAPGFISDAADPRLRVATCIGEDGCAQGTTATMRDAADLASLAARLGSDPVSLHVSGCAKGCAKASATTVTLVGADGRYDLVRNGRAGDVPDLRGLDLAGCRAALDAAFA